MRGFVVAVGVAMGSSAFGQASFTGLSDLSGGSFFSRAFAVSADGTAVAGQGNTGADEGALWVRSGATWSGPILLPRLAGGTSAIARACSNGGTVVFGESTLTQRQAVRWSVSGTSATISTLGFPPGGGYSGVAFACSADGSVAVGDNLFQPAGVPPPLPITQAFRWTSAGMVDLGSIAPLSPGGVSSARGVSGDGLIVAGYGQDASFTNRPWRWTQASGVVNVTGDAWGGITRGCSPDGSVLVGSLSTGGPSVAFKWTQAGGVVNLGTLAGLDTSGALDATSDGRRVCGVHLSSTSPNSQRAAIWDEGLGWRSVEQVLADAGVDTFGWTLTFANAMSDDGTVIAGYGLNAFGLTEAWVAVVPLPGATCPVDLDDDGDVSNGLNPDGGVDINDLLAFLVLFEEGNVAGDLDDDGDPTVGTPDGGVDINDLLFFLARFEAGC